MHNILSENVLKEIGIDRLPKEQQEEALTHIGNIIFQGVILRIIDELNDADQEALDKLLDEKRGDSEALYAFLKEKVPAFDEIVNEEVALFKQDGKNFAKSFS